MLATSSRSVSLTTRSGLLVVRPGPVVLRANRGVNRLDHHLGDRYGQEGGIDLESETRTRPGRSPADAHDRQDEPEERGSAATTGHARSAARSFRPRRLVDLLRLVGLLQLFWL